MGIRLRHHASHAPQGLPDRSSLSVRGFVSPSGSPALAAKAGSGCARRGGEGRIRSGSRIPAAGGHAIPRRRGRRGPFHPRPRARILARPRVGPPARTDMPPAAGAPLDRKRFERSRVERGARRQLAHASSPVARVAQGPTHRKEHGHFGEGAAVDSAPVTLQSVHHPSFLSRHSIPQRRQCQRRRRLVSQGLCQEQYPCFVAFRAWLPDRRPGS